MRVTKLPSFKNQFGEDNNTFAGVRQSRLGVKVVDADQPRRAEDDLRVRAVRHRRRRRPDDVPPAPRLRRARLVRRGPVPGARSWTRTSSPTRSSTWGPTGMVFFRNVQFRWMPIQGRQPPDAGARASGRQRRRRASTPTASSCRTSRAASRPRLSAVSTPTAEVGLRPGGRHAARDQVGRRARRPVRSERQRHGMGHELQLQPEVRQGTDGCPPPAAGVSAKASRTT